MDKPKLIELALSLETSVWHALAAGDSDADTALLSDRFLGVYPTGYANRAEHAGQLAAGPTVHDFAITDPLVEMIGDNDFRLTYAASYRRSDTGPDERMYVTSIWSRRDEGWINTFSQDTPAQGAES